MSDNTVAPGRPGRGVLVWAIVATFAAVIFANIALVLWVRLRAAYDRVAMTREESAPRRPSRSNSAPSIGAFDQLKDEDVAGHYRFFVAGVELGTIKLLPNHSIINKD